MGAGRIAARLEFLRRERMEAARDHPISRWPLIGTLVHVGVRLARTRYTSTIRPSETIGAIGGLSVRAESDVCRGFHGIRR